MCKYQCCLKGKALTPTSKTVNKKAYDVLLKHVGHVKQQVYCFTYGMTSVNSQHVPERRF